MSVTNITPRMQKALRDGKPLTFFADIWACLLRTSIDTMDEWNSCVLENIDTELNYGWARIKTLTDSFTIGQDDQNSALDVDFYQIAIQKFYLKEERSLKSITVKVNNDYGSEQTVYAQIVSVDPHGWELWPCYTPPGLITSQSKTVAAGYSGDITFDFNPVDMPGGVPYWILVSGTSCQFYYQNSDSFSDGFLSLATAVCTSYPYGWWTAFSDPNILYSELLRWNSTSSITDYPSYDLYFLLKFSGFSEMGKIVTPVMDVGEPTVNEGILNLATDIPSGTSVSIQLIGSENSDLSDPVQLQNFTDGASIPAGLRYFQATISLYSDANFYTTPQIDLISILYPKTLVRLRVKEPLLNVDESLLSDYAAILTEPNFQMSDIKPIERLSSGGEVSLDIEDPTGAIIRRLISDNPLFNYMGQLYIGADVPGFSKKDMVRFFSGTVSAVNYVPKYRKASAKVTLKFKNVLFDLKRKVPGSIGNGIISLDDTAINFDGIHVMDAMLAILRGNMDEGLAGIPSRFINTESFISAKKNIGDELLPAASYLVRRSDAAGLPDTTISSPEEVNKFLSQLLLIADGYLAVDEFSRLTFIKHDPEADPEEYWADERLVMDDGINAVSIEGCDSIDLGYDSRLFNVAYMGCEWDGDGDDWTAFSVIYAGANANSVREFAPDSTFTASSDSKSSAPVLGHSIYISLLTKNMLDASKWLGPQSGYNGESIASALVQRYVDRYGYPPVVMKSVVVSNSEFMRTLGSVVQVWSREFCMFKRRGIALSESMKFMIIGKRYDNSKNRMVFDLMEIK